MPLVFTLGISGVRYTAAPVLPVSWTAVTPPTREIMAGAAVGSSAASARSERGLDRHEPVDLAGIAAEALLARRREAEQRGLRVEAHLQAAPASGDPRLVERLAANLLDNALQHNVEGGLVSVHTGTSGDRAVISVANSGPAVPPDEVDRLFEPFQRPGAARTDQGEGSGLGLSIVRAIALAHGADVDARALPEGGLEVEVRFPLAPDRDADQAADRTA